jgi:hypothetical protein
MEYKKHTSTKKLKEANTILYGSTHTTYQTLPKANLNPVDLKAGNHGQ